MRDKNEPDRQNPELELAGEKVWLPDQEPEADEFASLDAVAEGEEPDESDEEVALEQLHQVKEEAYGGEIAEYTDDPEIQEALEARQKLDTGRHQLEDRMKQHHATSPDLSAGDVDAAWDAAGVGEETVGGTAPTPDQDIVEDLGQAVGITYEAGEPLQTKDKLESRDRQRWELEPGSAEDEEDEWKR